jgi:SAM-dependent MidA family methyltransferase
VAPGRWRTWRAATEDALYGPDGFYHRPSGGPGHHYRTSSTASPLFAAALARLAVEVDVQLGRPERFDLVEIAAARGVLLTAIGAVVETLSPDLASRTRLTAVELAARPPGLPDVVGWVRTVDEVGPVVGLVVANEWLDNVAVDVVEATDDGPVLVEVDDSGEERLGPPVDAESRRWLERWWPGLEPGDRAEPGGPRDEAWSRAVGGIRQGLAVAVDYAHDRDERAAGAYCTGTLTGYREGRSVLPVPDGSTDITAHVALDACAAAGETAGASATLLLSQREALRALGVGGAPPPLELAGEDPPAYVRALAAAGQEAELLARGGLGDFGWLVQAVGTPVPSILARRSPV